MDKRIKTVVYEPIKPPFGNGDGRKQREEAKAYQKTFGSGIGAKVLDQLIIDMGYFEFTPPSSPEMMGFELGKKYVVNHILRALNAKYKERDELSSAVTLTENDDD